GVLLAVLLPAAGAVPQPGNPSLGSGSNLADSIASAQPLDSVSAQSGWSTPVNISQSPEYDNMPAVAASRSGAVAIVWERRKVTSPTANYILAVTNAGTGEAFGAPLQLGHSEPQKT